MKAIINVTVDVEVLKQFKDKCDNVSGFVQQSMVEFLRKEANENVERIRD